MKFYKRAFYLLFFASISLSTLKAQCQEKIPSCPSSYETNYFLFLNQNKELNKQKAYQAYYESKKRRQCLKTWTVLIYMQADNDLESYALWDLYEMDRYIKGFKNKGTSTDKVDVLVELDLANTQKIQRLHMFQSNLIYGQEFFPKTTLSQEDFKGKNMLRLIQSPIVKFIEEKPLNTFQSQKKRFEDFLYWGTQNYPSEYYMVILWGHGRGYFNDIKKSPQTRGQVEPSSSIESSFLGGVAFDYSNLSFLDIPSLQEVLQNTNSHLSSNQKINVIAMDACLMQTLEVDLSLSKEVDYILASSQVQNYMGLPYRALWDELNEKAVSLTPYDWVKAVPKLFETFLKKKRIYKSKLWNQSSSSFTYSGISTAELNIKGPYMNFIKLFMKFSETLHNYLKKGSPMRKSFFLLELQKTPYFIGNYRDIGNLIGTVLLFLETEQSTKNCNKETRIINKDYAIGCKLKEQSYELLNKLNMILTTYSYGENYVQNDRTNKKDIYFLGFFKGFSVWFPDSQQKFNLSWDYMKASPLLKYENPWKDLLIYLFKKN